MFNADATAMAFALPEHARPWRIAIDTAQQSPRDVCPAGEERALESQSHYPVESRSCAVLIA